MEKRVIGIFCTLILMFTVVYYRVFLLSEGESLAQVAKSQSTYTLDVASARGMIYDCNFAPLVNRESALYAAVLPCPQTAAALRELLPKEQFLAALESQKPLLVRAKEDTMDGTGINVFSVPQRYGGSPCAVHVVGHLQGSEGVYGIEKAYDEFLRGGGGAAQVRYRVDATGRALTGEAPEVLNTLGADKSGLVLTIDERIQRIAERAAERHLGGKGAVVVMECATGDLRAVVSLPAFDPDDVSASLDKPDTPFVNKAFAPRSVGSGFKLVVTAAALENGIDTSSIECKGSVDIGGQVFKCNNHAGHGWVDLKRALEVSCNPYFISLAGRVGADALLEEAYKFGFGRGTELAPGMQSAEGTVPTPGELQSPAALANFGFGQGTLMATPVQMACMVSVLANGGYLAAPRLVRGYSDESGAAMGEELPEFARVKIISDETAAELRALMVSVVEEGSGKKAKPRVGGAGGKTGSAQTGQYYDNEKTNEIVEAWFIGFFPAEAPRYSVAVLAQGADSGSTYAAPVFKEIADGIGNIH